MPADSSATERKGQRLDWMDRDSLVKELRAAREELARRVAYQEDFREGVFQMLKDLDKSERDLEEACRKLKDTRDQLIQSSKMTALGELAAGLAHELNQPLTVIKGLSMNMLRAMEPSSPGREKLHLIAEASGKMELIIKHLRIFSRNEAPELVPVDVNDTVNDAFVMVKELLLDHAIEVEMDLNPLPLIMGSPTRLEQVIINLITNAKDAMPGGSTLKISTMPLVAGGSKFVRLSIRDSGAGIKKEHLHRIFDPFFTTKKSGKGTGLGLSISYGIVKEHSGDITVESSEKGTTFHITIPAARRP
ncbi:MAG: sensor histidine kinase [Thermodesulfobacteriota bacterium]